MPAIFLTESDVQRLLDIRMAVDAVEGAFQQLAASKAMHVPRVRASAPGIVLHSMSAGAEYLGLVGWKCYTTTRHAAKFLLGLYDNTSGELLALVEADHLGRLRTGAASGVAAEWLAAPEASELGLFGTGKQAATQLAAIATVRPLQRVFVYSRSPERREAFAEEMSQQLDLEVVPVDRPQEAVEDLPIVVTATSSAEPVLHGRDLAEGTLVCAVGSNWPNRAEVDAHAVRRADHVVCDSVEACRREAGDLILAVEQGVFDWRRAVDLADVVVGRAVGRATADEVVLFKSVGLAIEDVALGAKLLERARAEGAGVPLPF